MKGHVRLGKQGDLRPYLLIDPHQYHAEPANPMAPRLNTGEKFAELTGWAEWVQEDWQGGVGRTDPAALGVLFSEADTRVPNQLILPPSLGCVHTWPSPVEMYLPRQATAYSTTMLLKDEWLKWTATTGSASNTYRLDGFWVLIRAAADNRLLLRVYQNGVMVAQVSAYGSNQPSFQWLRIPVSVTLAAGAAIEFHLNALADCELPAGNTYPGSCTRRSAAGVWSAMTVSPFFLTNLWASALGSTAGLFSLTRTGAGLFGLFETGAPGSGHKVQFANYEPLGAYFAAATPATALSANKTVLTSETYTVNAGLEVPGNYVLEVQGNGTVQVTDFMLFSDISNDAKFVASPAVLWDGSIYVALGDGHAVLNANTGAGSVVAGGASAFASNAGYLWRASGNQVQYSGDGTTWSAAVRLGTLDYLVRGLAGLGRDLYCANDEGLFEVTDGDLVLGITPWGTKASGQLRMVNHQGALYIPISGRILRFSADGTIMDVWMQRQDDLPQKLLGAPVLLGAMNQWLLAALDGQGGDGAPVLVWQTEGWHELALLPGGLRPTCVYYDRDLGRLWLATTYGFVFWIGIDDTAINPWNSPSSRYMPSAWVETPRFYGDLIKVNKDFESVFITGEFPAGTGVEVYYQSDQSATWRLLGKVSADGTELRWADYSLRPTGKWLKLGLLLTTTNPTKSPKIKAVVVKYMPMVLDRERWNLPLMLADRQEGIDGDVSTYTASQQAQHVRDLVRSVAPVVFEDMDGVQYSVKVVGASRQVYSYEVLPDGEAQVTWVYTVAVEQV